MPWIIALIALASTIILWIVVKEQQRTISQHGKWLAFLESELKKNSNNKDTTS